MLHKEKLQRNSNNNCSVPGAKMLLHALSVSLSAGKLLPYTSGTACDTCFSALCKQILDSLSAFECALRPSQEPSFHLGFDYTHSREQMSHSHPGEHGIFRGVIV